MCDLEDRYNLDDSTKQIFDTRIITQFVFVIWLTVFAIMKAMDAGVDNDIAEIAMIILGYAVVVVMSTAVLVSDISVYRHVMRLDSERIPSEV